MIILPRTYATVPIICQRYGNSLHFIYAKITKWENRMLQKWLRDKLQGYIIDIANRVLPQRMHELEVQHCLYAKKVIVKILRKNILGLCYLGYKTIILSPRIILLPQRCVSIRRNAPFTL